MTRLLLLLVIVAGSKHLAGAAAAPQVKETEVVLALPVAIDSAFGLVRTALRELDLGTVDPIREPDQRTARVSYLRRRSAQGGAYVILLARVARSGPAESVIRLSGLVRDVTASARERPLPLSSLDEDWKHVLTLMEKLQAKGATAVPSRPPSGPRPEPSNDAARRA